MKLNRSRYKSFVYTHIPKCAGSSFRQLIFQSAIDSGIQEDHIYIPETLGIPNNANLNQLNEKALEAVKRKELTILADHSKFNVHRRLKLNMTAPFYYTLIREPVQRFISHYNYFYYDKGYGNLKGVHLNELEKDSLVGVLKSLSNITVDYISNRFDKIEPVMTQNTLKRAVYNLENHFACFGIVEKMEPSLHLLNQYSPEWITIKTAIPMKNSTKVKLNSPKGEIIKLIKKHNKFDIDLYNFASKLFDIRYKIYE